MLLKINGLCYIELIYQGIKNLERYLDRLNAFNVFPVPDGDTGTNMLSTLQYGYDSIRTQTGTLSDIAQRFYSATVLGASGNSGAILSQFFKGISETFNGIDAADADTLAQALKNGYQNAYASVSKPVEGTILTVLKDASSAVLNVLPLNSINSVIDVFLFEAKKSLERTPELLPILKQVGVVDSGGSGIVYFFEGVKLYLDGKKIEKNDENVINAPIDFSKFNTDTLFQYGYCVDGVIQLTIEMSNFDYEEFKTQLIVYGDSIVTSFEGDKIKLHIHTKKPGLLIDCCQRYGEFLKVTIDNMSVQTIQIKCD